MFGALHKCCPPSLMTKWLILVIFLNFGHSSREPDVEGRINQNLCSNLLQKRGSLSVINWNVVACMLYFEKYN